MEVMLAVVLILVTLVLVFSSPPEEAETDLAVMKQTGYDALFYLDQTGIMRSSVSTGHLDTIKADLATMLPSSVVSDATICSTSCPMVQTPNNMTVIAIDYYVSGYDGNFFNKKVRLFMWKKF